MARVLVINGIIISNGALLKDAAVVIEGGRIKAVEKRPKPGKDCKTIDAGGLFVSPGFIDTHIHGDPEKVFSSEVRYGTTSILPAISCADDHSIAESVTRIKAFIKKGPYGQNVLGVRVEGPFISRQRAGAQDPRYIRDPDGEVLARVVKACGGFLKIMTVAPELKGAAALIKAIRKKGIIASIGHSAATYDEALKGIDAGITHATHIFNAMRGIDPSASLGVDGEHGRTIDRREPGASGAALLDKRVTAEVIADLVHVDKALLRLLFKTKDRDKVILITDSIDAEAAHNKCSKSRGAYRFKDGTLAGSFLHMIEAVRNAVTAGGLSIAEAVRLATENPARILGLERRKGVIAKGMDADIVLFDRNFNVKATIIMGNLVFSGPSFANIRMTKYKQRTTRLDITEGKCAG